MNKKEVREYQKKYFQKNKYYLTGYMRYRTSKKRVMIELINIFNHTHINTVYEPMIKLYNYNSKLYEYRNNILDFNLNKSFRF